MTGLEILYATAALGFAGVLSARRAWRELPALFAFACASALVALVPWHPDSLEWSKSWGLGWDALTFSATFLMFCEVLRLLRFKVRMSESRWLLRALLFMSGTCSFVFWRFVPTVRGDWYFRLMSDRQLAMLELFFAAVLIASYILNQDVEVPAWLRAHTLLLCALLAGRNVGNIFDPTSGAAGGRFSWNALNSFWYVWSALCFMTWTLALPWLISRARREAS